MNRRNLKLEWIVAHVMRSSIAKKVRIWLSGTAARYILRSHFLVRLPGGFHGQRCGNGYRGPIA
jgi:hypothetical protein